VSAKEVFAMSCAKPCLSLVQRAVCVSLVLGLGACAGDTGSASKATNPPSTTNATPDPGNNTPGTVPTPQTPTGDPTAPAASPGTGAPAGAASCADVADCANACAENDQTCVDGCVTTGNAGAQIAYQALDTCAGAALQGSCASSCTDVQSDACWQCIDNACAAQVTACFGAAPAEPSPGTPGPTGTMTCAQIAQCFGNCGDGDETCFQSCFDKGSATAQQQLDALDACYETAYSQQCQTQCAAPDSQECFACMDSACTAAVQACS
jgi:hypothetical protein